jgi:thioredoxin reductase
MAQLNTQPYPPGDYPVVVVGTGPGGLQTSYCLGRLGIEHALLSSDEAPGGMFRLYPILQRLISWSKPYAPSEKGTRAYLRFDWNSLIADDPNHQALVAEMMDGTSYFPSRQEMEKGMLAFAERAGVKARYGCTWESTRGGDNGFIFTTSDGDYRCKVAVFAMGMAKAWKPSIPGLEEVPHYVDTGAPKEYAGRSVFIIGKRNSGFELADGLLPWARQIVLASPRPTRLSVLTHSIAAARARYLQPYEDHVLGGGNVVLDASIERVERYSDGYRVHAKGTTRPGDLVFDVDDVIAATGFEVPLGDLPELGVATFMQGRLPAQTPFWESASAPGIYFAGAVTQGSIGLKKYGIPSASASVEGFRHNARVLVRHIAQKHFGVDPPRPQTPPEEAPDLLLREATWSPELWNQRAYLSRALIFEAGGVLDEGIVPLAHFVDSGGADGVAIAVETNAEGDIHPVVYLRKRGDVEEHLLPSSPLHDYRTAEYRAEIAALLKLLGGG